MKLRNLVYFLREAFKSMSRNRLLSIATVSTVAICILILGIAVLITVNAGNFISQLESDVEIVAFLDDTLSKSKAADIKDNIQKLDGVKSVQFVSKQEALQRLQEKFGKNEYNLAETIGDNPLPNTYEIKARDPHKVPGLASRIGKINGVYKVNYGQGVVERLFKVTSWIRGLGIVVVVLLVFGAVFLIATTIRLAIFSRRREIHLMKLIGATDWFVACPFFIEGVLLGSAGALIAILVLAMGYGSLLHNMGSNLFFIPMVNSQGFLTRFYLYLVLTGAALGVIGTSISLKRYLQV